MTHKLNRYNPLLLLILLLLMASCSSTKYVSEGNYLLRKVGLTIDDANLKEGEFKSYISQTPNHKTFGVMGVSLFFYNLSGSDTTRWVNRWLRDIGAPPVIYDSIRTEQSRQQIKKAISNSGYPNAQVYVGERPKGKKMDVHYYVVAEAPYHIEEIHYNVSDPAVAEVLYADSTETLLRKGGLFDQNRLDEERQRITKLLQNRGYYSFNKEYINYTADTIRTRNRVYLTLNIIPPRYSSVQVDSVASIHHARYTVRDIYFVTDYDPLSPPSTMRDTVEYAGYHIIRGESHYIKESTLANNCYIEPNSTFSSVAVDRTYSAMGRLRLLKYVNIRFQPRAGGGDERDLDCYIQISPTKTQTLSAELEGTNSAGNLGCAAALTYQHRNIFRGSQTLTTKFRAAYESLGGLGELITDNYTELGAETTITYPEFLFPFLKRDFRKRLRSTTDFALNLNFQERPEYTRVIAGGGWRYNWANQPFNQRHVFDLVDISYIYLPHTTDDFLNNIDTISADNPMLRYSYENHFIMRSSYTYYRSNLTNSKFNRNFYTLRLGGEAAGNLLNALSSMTHQPKGEYGEYNLLGIRYAQYAKADVDYAYTIKLDSRNSITLHSGVGVAYPYGNSESLPFEKRYLSGGANSVRGWSVRSLGPGTYSGGNEVINFMNQCGDIRLDLNAEYRSKLVWKMELALFADAGNIWTIKDYSAQPGGMFYWNKFYKEIAMAYGLGLRFDFDFFLLRLDLGIKGYDPSRSGSDRWVKFYEDYSENMTLHFAVGYPF